MRSASSAVLLFAVAVTAGGCATEPAPEPGPASDVLQIAWTESVRAGDVIVAVPGTGTYTDVGMQIEAAIDPAHPTEPPTIEGRMYVANVEVLEGAIAVAERAGFTAQQIEAGEIDLAIWGAGITKLTAFRYISLAGLHVTFTVIGGTSVCAVGGIPENLPNYNDGNADKDARDLYRRLQSWSAATSANGRKVTLVAHSWGGIVAEYLASHLATYVADHGPLAGTEIAFVVAGGVPGYIPNFKPHGPGFRTVASADPTSGGRAAVRTYEVDRPDDPVHSFDPNGNGGGHHYIIRFGDDYLGWYGVTTDELSCGNIAGECPHS